MTERAAVISGAGQSDVGRRLYRDRLDLTIDAALAAIEDAGLTRADIDGLATYPGNMDTPPGFSGVGVVEMQDALRLNLDWYNGGLENPGQLGSVITACAAVAAGYANHVLCFRTVTEGSAQGDKGGASVTMGGGGRGGFRAGGFMQWSLPFGAPSAANWIAMCAQRHFHTYGTTREQLAQIALNARKNAALNPKAIYREPMTMDDYLNVRMITTPFCLYDCDVPADGSTAFVISRADAAADFPQAPVHVEAIGCAIHGRPSWDQWDDMTTMALRDAAAMMWQRTDLTPADVDVAELYDDGARGTRDHDCFGVVAVVVDVGRRPLARRVLHGTHSAALDRHARGDRRRRVQLVGQHRRAELDRQLQMVQEDLGAGRAT